MSCEHRFVPFPGSRAKLYCEFCGVGRDAFAVTERAPRRAVRRTRASERAQTETPLPFAADPDVDAARDALAEQRARADLEMQVTALVDAAGLPEDESEAIVREAMDFGPALDLDNFAAQLAALGDRQPTRVATEDQ